MFQLEFGEGGVETAGQDAELLDEHLMQADFADQGLEGDATDHVTERPAGRQPTQSPKRYLGKIRMFHEGSPRQGKYDQKSV